MIRDLGKIKLALSLFRLRLTLIICSLAFTFTLGQKCLWGLARQEDVVLSILAL